jgi:hypothetical protein
MLKVLEHFDVPRVFVMIEFPSLMSMQPSPSFDVDKMFPPEHRISFHRVGKAGPYEVYEEE